MKVRIGLLFASVVTLVLAACGQMDVEVSDNEAGDDQLVKQELVLSSHVHLMPMQSIAAPVQQAATVNAHLTYYGGKIIPAVKALSINWGASVNSTVTTGMPGFYAAITSSNLWDWLGAEYSTTGLNGADGQPGSNQALVHGTSAGSFTITPSITGTTISDAQIQTEISNQIASGKLPAPDDNTYYAINFPKGVKITQGGSTSCVQFCAYHGTFVRSGQNVYYGVLPSIEAGTGCDTGCGSSPTMFQNYTSVASHELVEAVTDADVGIGTTVSRPLAWYDSTNGEIGDICNANQGTITASNGTVYTVQTEFDNATKTCIVTKNVGGGTGGGTGGGAGGGGGSTGGGTGGGSGGGTGTGGGSGGGGGGDTVLGIGKSISGIAGAVSSAQYYQITVPAGTAKLTVAIKGSSSASNDADLYVKSGAHPTTTTYDCRPYKTGSNETCSFTAPAAGTYYVMVRGYTAFSGVTLSAK